MLRKILDNPKARRVSVLVLCMLFSLLVISPIMTNPALHSHTLSVIDRNKDKAMSLTATVTIGSTALSLLPDDTAAPLASELSDLSTPLLIIVCILYFEQFMFSPLQYIAFGILVPIALGMRIMYVYSARKSTLVLSKKLLLIALLCAAMIPSSAAITRMVEDTFAMSINGVNEKIAEVSKAFEKIIGGDSNGDILAFISNVAAGIGSVFEFARESLGLLIDGVAILMITSCVIPVITALLFVWGIKTIITGRMENLEDAAVSVISRFPFLKKKLKEPSQQA